MNGDLKPCLGSQIQLGHPLAVGLVGCWLMNEGCGEKVNDLSNNGHNGTFYGTPSPNWTSSPYGHGLQFNAVNSTTEAYVLVPNFNLKNSSMMSMGVICNATQQTFHMGYIGTRNADQVDGFYIAQLKNTSNLELRFRNSANTAYTMTQAVTLGVYNFIWLVYDGSNIYCYLNGLYKQKLSASGVLGTSLPNLKIGQTHSTVDAVSLNGLISYASYYNRALSANEVAQLYLDPFCMFEEEGL